LQKNYFHFASLKTRFLPISGLRTTRHRVHVLPKHLYLSGESLSRSPGQLTDKHLILLCHRPSAC
jgi:hypothetical protein